MKKKRINRNEKIFIIAIILLFVLSAALFVRYRMNDISTGTFGFGMYENNSQICEKLSDISRKDTCYNIVAINTKNPSICDRIEGAWQKNICYSGVAKKISGSENP